MSAGSQAPSITLPDSNGETFSLAPGQNDLPIALFFYPKSGSLGCTKEACRFRDAIAEKDIWKSDKVQVIGISGDPVDKQKEFVEKNKLTYPILSDEQGEARKAYGIEKGLFGDARITFVIDGKGVIRDSLNSGLNILAHSKFVTKWLETLDEEGKSSDDTAAAAATTTTTTETPTNKRKSILGLFNDFLKPNPKAEETPKSNE